jgi:hypothetical protein
MWWSCSVSLAIFLGEYECCSVCWKMSGLLLSNEVAWLSGGFHCRRECVLVGIVSGSTVNVRGRLLGGQFDGVVAYIGIEVKEVDL